jgi:hypothetical protein
MGDIVFLKSTTFLYSFVRSIDSKISQNEKPKGNIKSE